MLNVPFCRRVVVPLCVVAVSCVLAVSCGGDTAPEPTLSAAPEAAPAAPAGPFMAGGEPPPQHPFAFVPAVAAKGKTLEISGDEVRGMAMSELMRFQKSGGRPDESTLRGIAFQAANMLVDRQLAQRQAAEDGHEGSVEDAEAQVADIEKQMGEEFEQAMAANGTTRDELVEQFTRDDAVKSWVEEKLGAGVAVTDDQITGFYESNATAFEVPETVEVSHILVAANDQEDAAKQGQAKAEADDLLKQLNDGADFAELAREHSDCPSAEEGGNLGAIQKGRTVPPFEKAAFALKDGALSAVVKTQFGYHILRGGKHTEGGRRALGDVRDDISAHLRQQRLGEAFRQRVTELREEEEMEVLVPKPAPPAPPAGDQPPPMPIPPA